MAGVNRSDSSAPGDLGGFCRKGHLWIGAGGTADQRTGTEAQACGALQAQILGHWVRLCLAAHAGWLLSPEQWPETKPLPSSLALGANLPHHEMR